MIYLPFIAVALLAAASLLLFRAQYPQWWKLYLACMMGLAGLGLFVYWFIKSLW